VAPDLPADAAAWRARARAFAAERIAPIAAEIDRSDRVPDALLAPLAAAGFLGLGVPKAWDGSAGDTRSISAVLEELSYGSAAIGVLVSVHLAVCAHPILEWGTDSQRERFLRPLARGERIGAFALTEPGAGSDTAGLTTRYVRASDGFVLRGTKMFTSNGVTAGTILVFATRDVALGHRGISAFVVPPGTPGFSVAQRLDKLGLHGSETCELVLDGVPLPAESLLGPEGGGLKVALGALTAGRVGIASCALGVAQRAFDALRDAAQQRPEDWKRTALAETYTEVAAARALVERAAERKDAGAPYVREASVAKLAAARAAFSVASRGIDVAGPEGARAGAAAERLFRDARVFPIVEGTTEIQELILGRQLLDPAESRNTL
jgi:butyryl-CoA dehydrogenase